jgi:type I restriction enzyme, S subunit
MTSPVEHPKARRVVSSAPWPTMKLGDVTEPGVPALYGILQPGPDTPGGIPYVRPTEITEDVIQLADIRRTTPEIAAKYKRSLLKADDIILSIVGTIGKVALVPPELEGGNITQSSVRIRPRRELLLPRFLAWFLRSPLATRQYDAARLGTAVPRLNVAHVRDLLIPVPPLPEQRRIVAEIEQQFTRLDAGVAALRRTQANLKRYRAAVFKAACEGRLVPTEVELAKTNGSKYETGELLLARLLTERRKNWQGRGQYKEPAEPIITTLPQAPDGWTWCMSDAVFSFITSGSRGWAEYYSDSGPIFLRMGNLDHENIQLDLTELQHVAPPVGAEGVRTVVQPNDILISITADVGMVGLVPKGLGEAYINQHVALARPLSLVCPAYIAYYLCASEGGWGYLKTLQRGATKVGLGLDDIRSVPVPLPPLAEQTRIVAEVERRLSVVDELESIVKANLQRATRLRQSILKRAFSGS